MRAVFSGLAAIALLAPAAAFAQASGEPEGHGSPYSEGDFDDLRTDKSRPAKPPEPIARDKFEATVARMFAAADTNRDGTVTVAEFQAIIAARKEQAIQQRFAAIDTNRDNTLSYAEFSAWQRGLGSVVLNDATAGGGDAWVVAEEIRPESGRSRESQVIARLVEPLGTKLIVAANTNYDAGLSLAELTAYEDKRFDVLDTNKDGWLTEDELRAGRGGPGGPPPPAPRP